MIVKYYAHIEHMVMEFWRDFKWHTGSVRCLDRFSVTLFTISLLSDATKESSAR